MSLRIYLDPHWQDASSTCSWAQTDDSGKLLDSGSGTLSSLPQGDDVTVIAAAECVLAVSVALPDIKRSKLEAALTFALDDTLIDDAAEFHITAGPRLADGNTALYAINKNWLARFLDACALSRIRVRRIVPEYCLLPVRAGEWSLAWNGKQGFLTMTHNIGIALDHGSASHMPVALQLHLQTGSPTALRIFSLSAESQPPAWAIEVPLIFAEQTFDWRKADIPGDTPNLQWGKFAPPPRISEFWPWLRPALMAALLLFGVETVFSNIEWAVLAHERQQLMHRMDNTFRETFGANATVVNAPLQMRRNIARLRHATGAVDDADFFPLLDKLSLASSGVPGYRLRTLHYGDGRLDIALTLSSISALDTLLQHVTDSGLIASVEDRRDSGNALDVQLRLSTDGAAL